MFPPTIPAGPFPIKVIHGTGDILAAPRHAARLAARLRCPLVLLEGAHFITRDCAAEVRRTPWPDSADACEPAAKVAVDWQHLPLYSAGFQDPAEVHPCRCKPLTSNLSPCPSPNVNRSTMSC